MLSFVNQPRHFSAIRVHALGFASRFRASCPIRLAAQPSFAVPVRIVMWAAMILPLQSASVSAQEESIFPDKKLEAVVRKYVFEKRNNEEPLTAADVEKISTIEGKDAGVTDLTGLEKCLSLALLDLEGNQIKDIQPIAQLREIQSLNLARNQISDLSPLTELTKLQYLHLAGNQIDNLEAIAKMENMRSLYLSKNSIQDLGPIAGLTKIWSLYVDHNKIAELKPLAKLAWLSSLDLRNNQISDLSPLAELTELRYLMLDHNQVTDLEVLVNMAEQDAGGEQRFAPFWKLYLGGNPLTDAAKSTQVKKLEELGADVQLEPIE